MTLEEQVVVARREAGLTMLCKDVANIPGKFHSLRLFAYMGNYLTRE